ncbi:MAG TPA: hypothetical protein VJT08_05240 [Terriglobales bacterium]|nr:hypothetical protein [Terriglobales bacterium]
MKAKSCEADAGAVAFSDWFHVYSSKMSSWISHILTFLGGVAAKWIQDLLRERKTERRSFREQTLRPIREQVHGAIPELENGERVTTVDLSEWKRLVASGRAREIPEELRAALERLYTSHLPTYDKAWLAANEEVPRVMEMADENFGGKRAGADLPLAPWRKFLTGRSADLEMIGCPSNARFARNSLFAVQVIYYQYC